MFWNQRKILWTDNEVYAKAFRTLARGLWLSLGGMAAVLTAGVIFGLPLLIVPWFPVLKDATRPIVLTAGMVLVLGALLNLWAKWTCFELQQPLEFGQRLPGHRYLQTAIWCEVLSFILKTSARALGIAQLKALNLPLSIISQIAFLLFLRKVADVIHRPELKQRIDYIGVTAVSCLVTFGGAVLAKKGGLDPRLSLAGMAISGLLFILTLLGYLVLLGQFALAASAFARYLEEGTDYEDDGDEAEGSTEEPTT